MVAAWMARWHAAFRRRSVVGKLLWVLGTGLVLCCLGSVGVGLIRGTGQAIGLIPTTLPTPTAHPTATTAPLTSAPTDSVSAVPTEQPIPTEVATVTEVATTVPTVPPVTPKPAPRPTQPPVAPVASKGIAPQGSDCPADHPIKGNIRQRNPNKGAKIYHVPGDNGYAQTNPEQCFATTADAEAAGYRPVQ